jgi:hypothetical protein
MDFFSHAKKGPIDHARYKTLAYRKLFTFLGSTQTVGSSGSADITDITDCVDYSHLHVPVNMGVDFLTH